MIDEEDLSVWKFEGHNEILKFIEDNMGLKPTEELSKINRRILENNEELLREMTKDIRDRSPEIIPTVVNLTIVKGYIGLIRVLGEKCEWKYMQSIIEKDTINELVVRGRLEHYR